MRQWKAALSPPPIPHPRDPSLSCPTLHQEKQRRAGQVWGRRQGSHCTSTDVILPPSWQPEQLRPTATPGRATSCHPQTWPSGCSQANEPHEPHETCPAPRATRVSGAPAALPSRATGMWVGRQSGPPCSQPSRLPEPRDQAPATSLLAVMVPLLMRPCLGNRLPLSPQDRCPWSLPCGEWATRRRAR